jgi:hypothetical protein
MDTITILSVIIAGYSAYTILLLCGIMERDRMVKILRNQLRDADARLDNANSVAKKYAEISKKLQSQLDSELQWHATAEKLLPSRGKDGKFAKRGEK